MTGSKYEKYIVRQAMRPESFLDPMVADFMNMPPLIFLNGDNPVQGSKQFLVTIGVNTGKEWVRDKSPRE